MPDSEKYQQFPEACIVMFAKAPVPGKVKTRLIPALGEQGALDLYLWLLQRQMLVLNNSRLCSTQLWVDQNPEYPVFKQFKGVIKVQKGQSLGDRMADAVQTVLRHYKAVLIIGSDCPEIDDAYLEQALLRLNDNATDVVLGPALDGGYVLIGMKQACEALFEGIEWGTESVRRDTLKLISSHGLTHAELPFLRDIDTAEDLKSLL
tara:strand:+ start:82 stop:699 length:618 start_codon:yes stop_codon:yes gene_type:complete